MPENVTKRKMLNKARALFWSKGYNATSVREIARAYGCKPANVYNFFSKKEDILFEVLLEEMEKIINPIKALEEDEFSHPEAQLRMLIESHLKVTLSYRRSAKLLFDVELDNLSAAQRKKIVGMRDHYDRIIRKIIGRGIKAGCFSNVNPKLAGFMIASMITRTRIWYHPQKGVTVSQLSDFIYKFTLRGLKSI
ncbi:MAG: TetR/AcrR family transcriptional regulator [Deltaproteobacteria bacterium]|jgi:AcrR family transcriptional regulator|nr:TetR/AcrR family transcriptional regulator [Deltaproteobacteria bacterium]